jgi:hypothetical protein
VGGFIAASFGRALSPHVRHWITELDHRFSAYKQWHGIECVQEAGRQAASKLGAKTISSLRCIANQTHLLPLSAGPLPETALMYDRTCI